MVLSALGRNLELNLLVHGAECTGEELGVELNRSWCRVHWGGTWSWTYSFMVLTVSTGKELGVELTCSWCWAELTRSWCWVHWRGTWSRTYLFMVVSARTYSFMVSSALARNLELNLHDVCSWWAICRRSNCICPTCIITRHHHHHPPALQ